MRDLHRLIVASRERGGTQVIGLAGPHGIGKSALASRVLHDLHERYPGGQLHLDVRSYEPEGARSTTDALGQLLRALRSGPLPAVEPELIAWWRSATASREPLCLLLDNVADAATVRLLLPGGNGHLVVVTSHDPLVELAGDGASLHGLGPLPPDAARAYLIRCVGEERLRAEPQPTAHLVQLSAGVPQALHLTVAQLVRHPDRPVSSVVRSLLDSQRRTALVHPPLRLPGAIVTTHLDTAYAGLSRDAARAYRRMGLLPVLDIDASLTATILDVPPDDAAYALESLQAVQLLEQATPHDLRGPVYRWPSAEVRQHARQHALAEATDGETDEVLRRALGWALAATSAADTLITPTHCLSVPDSRHRPAHPVTFETKRMAMSWLKAQADSVLALIRAAHSSTEYSFAWRITYALWPWWRSDRRYGEWIEIHRLALDAVQRCQEPHAEWRLLNTLGLALRGTGAFDEAIGVFARVREMATRVDEGLGVAQALHEIGATYVDAKQPQEAVPYLEEAVEQRLDLGYSRGVALTEILLGQIAVSSGDYQKAGTVFSHARDLLLDARDEHDAARALAWRGRTSMLAGDISAAEHDLRTANAEFAEAEAPSWLAHTIEWLGEAAQQDRRPQDAQALYAQALDLYVPLSAHDADRLRERLRTLA
ncbi:tetratricopeptide repeat protein [Streptomyces sp. NPDC004732]|uniref:tetratricopeptide repeat protein n=1 Tax=Streptomyces sp. NPDC004732 TaxID=3154290 RepID=UPI0033AC829E